MIIAIEDKKGCFKITNLPKNRYLEQKIANNIQKKMYDAFKDYDLSKELELKEWLTNRREEILTIIEIIQSSIKEGYNAFLYEREKTIGIGKKIFQKKKYFKMKAKYNHLIFFEKIAIFAPSMPSLRHTSECPDNIKYSSSAPIPIMNVSGCIKHNIDDKYSSAAPMPIMNVSGCIKYNIDDL